MDILPQQQDPRSSWYMATSGHLIGGDFPAPLTAASVSGAEVCEQVRRVEPGRPLLPGLSQQPLRHQMPVESFIFCCHVACQSWSASSWIRPTSSTVRMEGGSARPDSQLHSFLKSSGSCLTQKTGEHKAMGFIGEVLLRPDCSGA